MQKLRIFVISPFSQKIYQAKQRGFAGTSESRVLKGFVNNEHEVHLLIPREVGVPEDSSYSGIFIHEFKVPLIGLGKNLMSRVLTTLAHYLYYFVFNLMALKRFMDVVKIYGRPSVIYGYREGSCAAYIVSRIYGVPNITRLFGIDDIYTSFSKPLLFFRNHLFFQLVAFKLPCRYLIITNDGTRGDDMARRLKIPSERVRCWMNGADFLHGRDIDARKLREVLQIPQQAHVIVSVCRLAKWKRVDRLIRAVPEIALADSNLKVLIIGEGEERENLERLSRTLGVTKVINFLGAVAHKNVEKYLRIADLFVSLYDYANLSSSLLEAMACGACIIALNRGASRVIKNGENGILISYDKIGNLSTILTHLLGDKDLRRSLGNKARRYALENFMTWDKRVSMEVELIERLIE